jgi:hypothetical protein
MAQRQHGVVSIRQLEGPLGFSQRSVARSVEAGRLHRVYRGVYAVGHRDLSLHGECLAAVLAVGPGALLSYWSAGWLWGLWSGSPKPIHVTAFVPRHHQPPKGVVRHRARNLVEADRAICDGIPVTSVARTLLDHAWKVRGDQLARALTLAEDLKFERRFVRHLIASGLPRPVTGWNEVGHELDVYWPEFRFGVELDAFKTHSNRAAFERDHERDLDFALAEIETVRVTERQFRREPDAITRKVATLIDRRARSIFPAAPPARSI